MTITREQAAADALTAISKPVSTNNLKTMVCWAASENTQAQFNPWATTLQYEASTDFNEAGVKNYATYENGIAAFKATILNGLYDGILADLAVSAPMAVTCSAIENSPWGSKPNSALQGEVASNYDKYANVPIGGGADATDPNQPTGGGTEQPSGELAIGTVGPAVEELQAFLDMDAGQHLTVDGHFGELTQLAVKNLQRIMGLTVDGIVGPETRAAITYIQVSKGQG
jgi:hypothetical protein